MPSGDYNSAKTHCRHGHPYDEQNTLWWNGHRSCRACQNTYQKSPVGRVKALERASRWRTNNREKLKETYRRVNLKRFGLSIGEYDEMAASQGGVCAICGNPNKSNTRLAVDHDHKTGLVRGLLCEACNPSLGLFNDNPATLREAAKYLINHV